MMIVVSAYQTIPTDLSCATIDWVCNALAIWNRTRERCKAHLEPKHRPSPSGTESDERWYLCRQWHLEPKPLAAHSLLHTLLQ
jgi:hypothetical protein